MARASTSWTVLKHGPLEKLGPRLWRVEGEVPGMPLRRVMTIAKLGGGGLVVHNAIALEPAPMAEIDAWGPVAFIVVPNAYHRIDAPAFAARYTEAKVLCPPGARAKVEEVVAVAGAYGDLPADPRVSLSVLDGTGGGEGVMIVRDEDGASLVFNDAIFNMPHVSGFAGFVFRHLTASSGGPKVSRVARWFVVKDKRAFKAHLERLAATADLRRIIVSHHETITTEPGRVLEQLAASL